MNVPLWLLLSGGHLVSTTPLFWAGFETCFDEECAQSDAFVISEAELYEAIRSVLAVLEFCPGNTTQGSWLRICHLKEN